MSAQGVRTPDVTSFGVERIGSVPREVRLTRSGVAMAVLAIVFAAGAVVIGIGLSIVIAREAADRELRQRDGVVTRGEVTRIARTGGDHPRLIVAYRYEVGNVAYDRTARLPIRARRDITAPGSVGIAYLRSDPARSWIVGNEERGLPPWVVPIASASPLLLAFAVTWSVRRQWVLLSEGRLADARVVATKKVARQNRRAFRVSYQFQTLSGAIVTGSADTGRTPPPVGATIPIVYHRDNPRWTALYPLPLVRPVRR